GRGACDAILDAASLAASLTTARGAAPPAVPLDTASASAAARNAAARDAASASAAVPDAAQPGESHRDGGPAGASEAAPDLSTALRHWQTRRLPATTGARWAAGAVMRVAVLDHGHRARDGAFRAAGRLLERTPGR
ncbi:hypothetical protein, partial [Nostocoides japonicum]|uniref:hypothetical protein n=1 Tax=Nostocoides japonicum TaxID=99481 RepID=UPI00065BF320